MSVKENRHDPGDLAQYQSLPLEAKIRMSKERIKAWYESWQRFEIQNIKTGKTRFVTMDTRDFGAEPPLKENEWIKSAFSGAVYVSFSGGKDSTVLADLCAQVCQNYGWTLYLLFVNTGLEYPEIQKFVKTYAEWLRITYEIEVVLDIVRPEMRFDEVLKTYGYPVISKEVSNTISGARNSIKKGVYSHRLCKLGVKKSEYGGLYDSGDFEYEKNLKKSKFRQDKWKFLLDADFDCSHYCCDVMKKRPAAVYQKETGRIPIIATMASESLSRKTAWEKHGCNAFEKKKPTSQPMSFWTEQDVLHYLKKYMQKDFDEAWDAVKNACGYKRRKARKFLKAINYQKKAYCSVYGDIVVDFDLNDDDFENQMNIIDYIGCYEPEDKLKTTGCDRTGCIFCMFGCHLEKEPNRFQRLKETHPRQYQYCIGGGDYVTEGYWQTSSGEFRHFAFEYDDGTPYTPEEIDNFIEEHKGNPHFKFERKWQPSKEGLGLGKVLDYIGVKYD